MLRINRLLLDISLGRESSRALASHGPDKETRSLLLASLSRAIRWWTAIAETKCADRVENGRRISSGTRLITQNSPPYNGWNSWQCARDTQTGSLKSGLRTPRSCCPLIRGILVWRKGKRWPSWHAASFVAARNLIFCRVRLSAFHELAGCLLCRVRETQPPWFNAILRLRISIVDQRAEKNERAGAKRDRDLMSLAFRAEIWFHDHFGDEKVPQRRGRWFQPKFFSSGNLKKKQETLVGLRVFLMEAFNGPRCRERLTKRILRHTYTV